MFDTRNDLPANLRVEVAGISRAADKHLWLLEVHLHAKR